MVQWKYFIVNFFVVEEKKAHDKVAIVPAINEYTAKSILLSEYPEARIDMDNIKEFIDLRSMFNKKEEEK